MVAPFTQVDPSALPVAQLVTQRPARARVLDVFGIDYASAAGHKTLAQACADLNLNLRHVAGVLELFDTHLASAGAADDDTDWSKATLAELADHIEHTHHAFLKDELPHLELLVRKVATLHGQADPRLLDLRRTFASVKSDLELHMAKEERTLFPACRHLTAAHTPIDYPIGSLQNPVAALTAQHDDYLRALHTLRALTDDYTPRPDASPTHRAMLDSLASLDRDLRRHLHKENAILFPAALAAQRRLRALRHTRLSI